MYETILLPTDGSEHASRAADQARYLADVFDATVHVVTVVDTIEAGGLFDAGGLDDDTLDRLEAAAEAQIDQVRPVFEDGPTLETAVVRGRVSAGILEYADEHDVDLVAMGTHGRTGLDHVVLGSVAERVSRRCSAPVLTVRATEASAVQGDYEDIIVPTDGSEVAATAADHAIAVAERSGARIRVASVVDVGDVAHRPSITPTAATIERLEAAAESETDAIAERARSDGVEATTEVLTGYPPKALLSHLADTGVDLVAMGTHGRTGLSRFVLGSTTERVIRRADVPVLAVKPDEGDQH